MQSIIAQCAISGNKFEFLLATQRQKKSKRTNELKQYLCELTNSTLDWHTIEPVAVLWRRQRNNATHTKIGSFILLNEYMKIKVKKKQYLIQWPKRHWLCNVGFISLGRRNAKHTLNEEHTHTEKTCLIAPLSFIKTQSTQTEQQRKHRPSNRN